MLGVKLLAQLVQAPLACGLWVNSWSVQARLVSQGFAVWPEHLPSSAAVVVCRLPLLWVSIGRQSVRGSAPKLPAVLAGPCACHQTAGSHPGG